MSETDMEHTNGYLTKIMINGGLHENKKLNKETFIENLNKNLFAFENDYLSHLNLSTLKINFKETFGDVKFVCMGGSAIRMKNFAHHVKDYINFKLPFGQTFENVSELSDRYAMFKVGPILSLSHGMGCPSISILLNEILKLIHYAECKNVTFFRLGTSGGLNIAPGTLVITEEAVDGMFRPEFRQIVLGEEIIRKTKLNGELVKELLKLGESMRNSGTEGIHNVIAGRTLCAHDFYEGQGRLDGIFCNYTEEDKMRYLLKCKEHNVVNMEMESLCFAGFFNYANLKAAVICVTILDRLKGDKHNLSRSTYEEFQEKPIKFVCEYIKRNLEN